MTILEKLEQHNRELHQQADNANYRIVHYLDERADYREQNVYYAEYLTINFFNEPEWLSAGPCRHSESAAKNDAKTHAQRSGVECRLHPLIINRGQGKKESLIDLTKPFSGY